MAISRRRPTRGNVSATQDSIENDPSQAQTQASTAGTQDGNDVPSQHARGPRASRVKKEKTKNTETQERRVENGEIDFANFPDQPLLKEEGPKLASQGKDWEQWTQQYTNTAVNMVASVAEAMAEVGTHNDDAVKELEKLDAAMRRLIDKRALRTANGKVIDDIRNKLARGEEITGAINLYEQEVNKLDEAWHQKTSRQKYAKDDDYVKFKDTVWRAQHSNNEAMPPMIELIPQEDGDNSDDDEIYVGGVTQDFKCPLALTIIVKPLTSSVCKHTFSAAAIQEYMGKNRGLKKKCPASGCNKLISLDDLKPDLELEKKIKAHQRRERERQDEEVNHDDDEVIE